VGVPLADPCSAGKRAPPYREYDKRQAALNNHPLPCFILRKPPIKRGINMRREIVGQPSEKQKQLHNDVTNVGLRAQATAVGLIQLCIELRKSNALSEEGLGNVKKAIADELLIGPYRRYCSREQRVEIETRIDRIFAGEQKVGPAEELSFVTEQ
jgi:hypothetical protein